jgi:hypothetical protein
MSIKYICFMTVGISVGVQRFFMAQFTPPRNGSVNFVSWRGNSLECSTILPNSRVRIRASHAYSKNLMSLISSVKNYSGLLARRVTMWLSVKNCWHASKWSSISFWHWQYPPDRDFTFPRFVGLLILSLWVRKWKKTEGVYLVRGRGVHGMQRRRRRTAWCHHGLRHLHIMHF